MCAIRRKKHFINISRKKYLYHFLIWRADKIPKMFAFLRLLETDFVIRQKFFDKLQQRLFFLWLRTRKSQFLILLLQFLKRKKKKTVKREKNKSQMHKTGSKAKLLHNIFWIKFWWKFRSCDLWDLRHEQLSIIQLFFAHIGQTKNKHPFINLLLVHGPQKHKNPQNEIPAFLWGLSFLRFFL